MEFTKLETVSDPLRYGLLSDQILHISRTKKALTPEDRRLLLALKTLVMLSEDGLNQARTGTLNANALDSISAYRTILAAASDLKNIKADTLSKMLSKTKVEIENILEDGKISPATSGRTRWISKAIRNSAIRTIGKALSPVLD